MYKKWKEKTVLLTAVAKTLSKWLNNKNSVSSKKEVLETKSFLAKSKMFSKVLTCRTQFQGYKHLIVLILVTKGNNLKTRIPLKSNPMFLSLKQIVIRYKTIKLLMWELILINSETLTRFIDHRMMYKNTKVQLQAGRNRENHRHTGKRPVIWEIRGLFLH